VAKRQRGRGVKDESARVIGKRMGKGSICRVFPGRTNATPNDDLVSVGDPKMFDPPDCDEIHISVTFSWDLLAARRLYRLWSDIHPKVLIGGPALDDRGGPFVSGQYLKPGYVITSRGCPNNCWFCLAKRREGEIRELPISCGYNVLDNNLLACSESHIRAVFDMLADQGKRPVFTGGLDSRRLQEWHVRALREIGTDRIFLAYDAPEDLQPLEDAGKLLRATGFTRKHHLYSYVLIGYPRDTFEAARKRFQQAWEAGFVPFAMLYRDESGRTPNRDWKKLQREWIRPAIIRCYQKEH